MEGMLLIRIRRKAAGVELRKLLWVRCRNIEQSLRATDLVLQGGGFGFIAVDLATFSPVGAACALESWFRFRRAVEDTPTVLVLLEQESNARRLALLWDCGWRRKGLLGPSGACAGCGFCAAFVGVVAGWIERAGSVAFAGADGGGGEF